MMPIIILLVTFLLEGLGITLNQTIFSFIYGAVASIIVFLYINKKIKLPYRFFLVSMFFLILSLISSLIFLLYKLFSFNWWFYYLACFLLFIYFYNYKEQAKKLVKLIIIYLTPIFLCLFFVKLFTPHDSFLSRYPLSEDNLFWGTNQQHNHLGIMVGLIFTFFLWKFVETRKKQFILIGILVFPLILGSYSRSAIFATLVILAFFIFLLSKHLSKKAVLILSATLIIGFLFLIAASGLKTEGAIKNTGIYSKDALGLRNIYWQQGLKSFIKNPLFGTGFGNYGIISYKYQVNYDDWIDNAANIFLEILVGGGLTSFVPLLILISLIVFSRKNKNDILYLLLTVFLFVDFQTDFSYKNRSIFLLLVILSAILYEEKNNLEATNLYKSIAGILLFILSLIGLSWCAFLTNKLEFAQKIFPFNKSTYGKIIEEKIGKGNYSAALKYGDLYYNVARFDYLQLTLNGQLYEKINEPAKALIYYEKIYEINHFCDLRWIKKIYNLKKITQGDISANSFITQYIEKYGNKIPYESAQTDIYDFCILKTSADCPLRYFYEPKPGMIIKNKRNEPYRYVQTINRDTLNERFNYPVEKDKKTYRIITLGDSFAYGKYIDTAENWTELLEEKLNKGLKCSNINKFEIINLGGQGYDISYTIERYKKRGIKYKPDLLIWPIRSIYLYNEIFLPKQTLFALNNEKILDTKEIWEEAYEDTIKTVGEEKILFKQKKQLLLFSRTHQNLVYFDLEDINKKIKEYLPSKSKIFSTPLNESDYFLGTGILNKKGNIEFAGDIYNYLINSSSITCLK